MYFSTLRIFLFYSLFFLLNSFSSFAQQKPSDKAWLENFYTTYLNEKKVDSSLLSWEVQEIDDLAYRPESPGPINPEYNRSIFWLKEKKIPGKKKWGFRPIATTTGCKSGCTPVVFHLVINPSGDVEDIIYEKEKPLRKVWHQPFDENDKLKLLILAKTLPSKLSFWETPLDATNNRGPFPPQTWTYFRDVLVEGGAYTSYVVYHNAVKTKKYLNQDISEKIKESNEQRKIENIFAKGANGESQFIQLFQEVQDLLDQNISQSSQNILLRHLLLIVQYYVSYSLDVNFNEKMKSSKLSNIIAILNKYHSQYSTYLQGIFSDFLLQVLQSSSGASFILMLEKEYMAWSKLSKETTEYLPLFAKNLLGKKIDFKDPNLKGIKQRLLDFSILNPFLLEQCAKIFYENNDYENSLDAYINFTVRFPNKKSSFSYHWPEKYEASLSSVKQRVKKIYQLELLREFHVHEKTLPGVNGETALAKIKKKVAIPLPGKQKQIYIFFAPWCAHCFELIKTLVERSDSAFWKKVQLVAVFVDKNSGDSQLEKFIDHTNLKQKLPVTYSELLALYDSEEVRSFYDQMGLFAVPKVVITDKKGQILNFSYEFNLDPNKDYSKDLDLILSNFDEK